MNIICIFLDVITVGMFFPAYAGQLVCFCPYLALVMNGIIGFRDSNQTFQWRNGNCQPAAEADLNILPFPAAERP